jgi:hypothetical protein
MYKDAFAGLTMKIKYEAEYLNEKAFKKRKQFIACHSVSINLLPLLLRSLRTLLYITQVYNFHLTMVCSHMRLPAAGSYYLLCQ